MYAQHCGLHVLLQVFPFPGKDEAYQVPFTRVVYIEQDDFREQDQKKYFGLAPGKSVLLRCHTSQTLLPAHLHGPRPAQSYRDQHSGEPQPPNSRVVCKAALATPRIADSGCTYATGVL